MTLREQVLEAMKDPEVLRKLNLVVPRERIPVPTDMLGFDGWLNGVRYSYEGLREGMGSTIVCEKGSFASDKYPLVELVEPIAGPVFRQGLWMNVEGDVPPDAWYAKCAGCGASSKEYKRRGEPQLKRWSQNHRCGQLDQKDLQRLVTFIQTGRIE